MYKKLFILAFTAFSIFNLFLCGFSSKTALAQESEVYMRVVDSSTPFYLDANASTLLFYLPCTYYVKVLDSNQNYTHVECFGGDTTPAIDGYVPTSKLQVVDYQVTSPYLSLTITTGNSCPLFKNSELDFAIYNVFENRKLSYYGLLTQDGKENLYYVCYNNKLGYVKESDVIPFTVQSHPTPLLNQQVAESKPSATTVTTSESSSEWIKTAIIICLSLAGVIALLTLLKGKKKPSFYASSLDDENDD